MTTNDSTENLRNYCQELNNLDSEDIRVPNQSLILDYFCRDAELTEFLRNDVFSDSAPRHKAWCTVNHKGLSEDQRISQDAIAHLVVNNNKAISELWGEIVCKTAKKQSNDYIFEYIKNSNIYQTGKADRSSNQEPSPMGSQNGDSSALVDFSGAKNTSVGSNEQISKSIEEGLESSSHHSHKSTTKSANALEPILAGFVGISVVTALGIMAGNVNTNTSTSTNTYLDSSYSLDTLKELESEQRSAVLICEHNPIIQKATALTLQDPNNIQRKENLVARSKNAIAELDQTSAKGYKYTEDSNCTWGGQWFDNDGNNEFRYFLATSNSCLKPIVHYKYARGKNGVDTFATGQANVTGTRKGEIRLPYADAEGEYYIFIDKVTC